MHRFCRSLIASAHHETIGTAGRRRERRRPLGALAAAALLGAGGLLLAGCAAQSDQRAAEVPAPEPVSETPLEELSGSDLAAQLAKEYVIGPAAARTLGYRIDWQYPASTSALRRFAVQHDSVFTLDQNNTLMRLRREEGTRFWQVPVGGGPMVDIQGITYLPDIERLYLTCGSELLVLDAANGSQIDKQKLKRIAATEPVVVGQYFVYGSRQGQVVWYSHRLASEWRGYQVSHTIQIPPVAHEGYIVAVGSDGRIMCLRADSVSQVWNRSALAPIVAPPFVGDNAVYVASLDQYVRAFELTRARSPLWEYLTESPLTEPPVLIGDRVYQQVPTEGLVCLEALPLDSPGGVVIWRAGQAGGTVLTRLRDTLIAWDRQHKRLELIDARLGAVRETIDLPILDQIMATDAERGNIYATATDGRIIRLVPRT